MQILVNILLVVNVFVCIALVSVVLMQQSEGGALGMGGGGGPGNFMTARGAGDLLTRITWILAFSFFVLSLSLVLLTARLHGASGSIVDHINVQSLDLSAPASAAKPTAAAPPPAIPAGPSAPAPRPQSLGSAPASPPADPLAILAAPTLHQTVPVAAPPPAPQKK